MKKGIILAIILITAILGVGFGTGYFTGIPTPAAPSKQAAVLTAASSAQVAASLMNQDAASAPHPDSVFATDGKHAIARNAFAIYKNPAENSQETVGAIQNGMLVEVLEKREKCLTVPTKPKSENPQEASDEYEDPYAGKTLDCYKVKKNGKEGWVADRDFLNFQMPVPTSDPKDLSWLFQRYGDSTWYYQETMNETSFTNEEYEKLIPAAKAGYEPAQVALRLTLVKSLEKDPNNPKLAGFKDKVEFLQQTSP